ncbi:MAG: DUF2723 domain-containing protein [Chloroflexota bacterium]
MVPNGRIGTNAKWAALIIGGVLALALFISTLQLTVNGSLHPYTTDVGEIQNALPRWGTLHFPGYPLYSLTGSSFVSILRLVGIEPAISASLFSAIFGAIAIALLIALELYFDVPLPAATLTALLFALSTSFWVDASIAEVHTLAITLMLASIIFALRFSRFGKRSDLLLFSLFAAQMLLHQRAMVFMGLGLLLLVLRQRQVLWRNLPLVLGVAFLSSLIYLYLPIRAWQGASWTFNQPGTWQGFWSLALDTKSERIITPPTTMDQWFQRARAISDLLSGEWPLLLILIGLVGNAAIALKGRVLESVALFFTWFPFLLLSLIIWEGRLSDALLAVNLPVLAMSALGLGLITTFVTDKSRLLGMGLTVIWLGLALFLFVENRPDILTLTRDPGAETVIQAAESINPAPDGQPITLMALWGNDYWSLAYAQAFQGKLSNINLVDHNADLQSIMDGPDHLLTLSKTFYLRPLSWWDQRFGRVYLSGYTPEIIEVDTEPPISDEELATDRSVDLENNIAVKAIELEWLTPSQLQLTSYWEALADPGLDYSVAVHLVSKDPPQGQEDIISQADSQHPVGGWYPTSRWEAGEIIRDIYVIEVPEGSDPQALRLSMYHIAEDGNYVNSEWITLPLPEGP